MVHSSGFSKTSRVLVAVVLVAILTLTIGKYWVWQQYSQLKRKEQNLVFREQQLEKMKKEFHLKHNLAEADEGKGDLGLGEREAGHTAKDVESKKAEEEQDITSTCAEQLRQLREQQQEADVQAVLGHSKAADQHWTLNVACPVGPLMTRSEEEGGSYVFEPDDTVQEVCSGHGQCDHKSGKCSCKKGFAGKRCDIAITSSAASGSSGAAVVPLTKGGAKEVEKSSSQLKAEAKTRRHLLEETLTILLVGKHHSASPEEEPRSRLLLSSIARYYPKVTCLVAHADGKTTKCPQPQASGGSYDDDFKKIPPNSKSGEDIDADSINKILGGKIGSSKGQTASSAIQTPYVFVVPSTVIEIHEHTNLDLVVELLLTTDSEIMGFLTLTPDRDHHMTPQAAGDPDTDHDEVLQEERGDVAKKKNGRKDGEEEQKGDEDDENPQQQRNKSKKQQQQSDPHAPGAPAYLLHTPCYHLADTHWIMRAFKAPYGYYRHERLAMYCDVVGDAFVMDLAAVRKSLSRPSSVGLLSSSAPNVQGGKKGDSSKNNKKLLQQQPSAGSSTTDSFVFDPEVKGLKFMDLWVRLLKANQALVNRTLLPGSVHHPRDESAATVAQLSPSRLVGFSMIGLCSECLLKMTTTFSPQTQLNSAFAEKHQVEAFFGPRQGPPIHTGYFPTSSSSGAGGGGLTPWTRRKSVSGGGTGMGVDGGRLKDLGRLQCVKSGGIYGHSVRGLYAPLCHRYQRQRDFKYFVDLWTDPAALGGKPNSKNRYGVSLHHGNLFGALRLNVELLWETDGDLDLIAFDDDHDAMMKRFNALKKVAQADGFEVKVTYPEKPWYTSFLRDKTDFQLNCRSVKDPRTRGRPPHIHNISLWYQGRKVFMNGFQNPWQSIRIDPGHDYREQYLAQQGWVLHYTNKSISCGVPGHPACLPSCNQIAYQLDHNYCAPDAVDPHELLARPLNPHVGHHGRGVGLPVQFRDPVLWDGAEGAGDFSHWWADHNGEF